MAISDQQEELAAPHGSLWALSADGLLWQINPVSRQAAPVMHLTEMGPEPRQKMLHQIAQPWRQFCVEEACAAPSRRSGKGKKD